MSLTLKHIIKEAQDNLMLAIKNDLKSLSKGEIKFEECVNNICDSIGCEGEEKKRVKEYLKNSPFNENPEEAGIMELKNAAEGALNAAMMKEPDHSDTSQYWEELKDSNKKDDKGQWKELSENYERLFNVKLSESLAEKHVHRDGDKTYVDTAFIQSSEKFIEGGVLKHMGFGEFYIDSPEGEIHFNRMAGKDFPGQSGRSHLITDDQDGQLAEKLVQAYLDGYGK